MVPDYPANSNKSKEEAKKLTPVVNSTVAVRKKKDNKFLRMIFAQDFKDVKQGLMTEYVEPKIKDLAWSFIQTAIDTVMNGAKMMVYKDWKPVDRQKIPAERYSYNGYYQPQRPMSSQPQMISEINYDEFTFATRGDAEAVLAELKNQIVRTRCATVLDLYNLSNVSTSNYTLQDWGWTDLGFAEVRQTSEGYIISLPKAKVLPR